MVLTILLTAATALLTVLCAIYAQQLARWGSKRRGLQHVDGPNVNQNVVEVGSVVVLVNQSDNSPEDAPPPHSTSSWLVLRERVLDQIDRGIDAFSEMIDQLDTGPQIVLLVIVAALMVICAVLFLRIEQTVVLVIAYGAVSLCALTLVTLLVGVRYGVGLGWNTARMLFAAVVSMGVAASLPPLLQSPLAVFGRFHDPHASFLPHTTIAKQITHLRNIYGWDIFQHLVLQALGCGFVIGVLVSILPRVGFALRDVIIAARGRPREVVHGLNGREVVVRCGLLLVGFLLASGLAMGGFLRISHRATALPSIASGGVTVYGADLTGVGLVAVDPPNLALAFNYCSGERLLRVVETTSGGRKVVVFSNEVGARPPLLSLRIGIDLATAPLSFTVTTTHHDPERIVMSQAPPAGSVVSATGVEPLLAFRSRTVTC